MKAEWLKLALTHFTYPGGSAYMSRRNQYEAANTVLYLCSWINITDKS